MSVVINTNLSAIAAQNSLYTSGINQQRAMERLSSGLRINNAKDDAAGLAIASRMTASIRGMDAAIRNANDGISATQIAEGGLAAIQDALQRIRELAVQAANGSNGEDDLASLDAESSALIDEIDRIVSVTTFNGNALIDGTLDMDFQVGTGGEEYDVINVTLADSANTDDLGIDTIDLTTDAQGSLADIDDAITTVTSMRSSFGTVQNRLGVAITNLQNTSLNYQASRSRILDTDYAKETTNLARAQIIQQAATAMLAQANQSAQSVLALLK